MLLLFVLFCFHLIPWANDSRYTYAISFAALIAAVAAESEFWDSVSKPFQATVFFVVLPLFLIVINALGVEAYGFLEILGGSLKIMFYVVIVGVLIAVNAGGKWLHHYSK